FLIYFKNENVLVIVAKILGIVFIIPSLIFLCVTGIQRSKDKKAMVAAAMNNEKPKKPVRNTGTNNLLLGVLPAVGGLCFGGVLLLKAEIFSGVLSDVFAILMIAFGLFHAVYMLAASHNAPIKAWYYIFPVLIMVGGIVTLFLLNAKENASTIVLITGLAMIISAVCAVFEYIAESAAAKETANLKDTAERKVEDVPLLEQD
ncbi:MAG: DUF308 domain-containing protein, partial [Muribaculaceae bacterium]|nr:DUF308 domain-containing protein [Muribaculaceae bacterium]